MKGLDGILKLPGGILLFVVGNAAITRLITWLTAPELAEDPHDLIANAVLHSLGQLSVNTKLLAAAYLFGHGSIKVCFVAGLWREKLWPFPAALSVISAFVLYQLLPAFPKIFDKSYRPYRH